MDSSNTTESLKFNSHSAYNQQKIREAINIFDDLADLYIDGILSSQYNSDSYMYLFLSNLIENDLKYSMDDKIIIQVKPKGFVRVSLKDTGYTMDQKANIYYFIYGWPFFKGYNNSPTFYVGKLGDTDLYMPHEGLGIYMRPDKDIYKYDSFLKSFLDDVSLASVDEQGEFSGAFIVLSMAYLTLNDYENYSDAQNNNFIPKDIVDDD